MPQRTDIDTGIVTETQTDRELKRPRFYRVLLHNDDFTTREFVVQVLQTVFHRSEPEAVRIMLHVHYNGVGVAGIYTREIAETKIRWVEQLAKAEDFPLRLSMEPTEEEDPD